MQGIIYEEEYRLFLLVTVAMGGGAARLPAGRSLRPGGPGCMSWAIC
jgi:hypothetical protein